MTPVQKIAGYALAALLLIGGTAWGIKHHAASKGVKAEAQAATFSAEAKVETTQAQASDAKVPQLQARVVAAEQTVASLQAERLVLLKRLAAKPAPADPTTPATTPVDDPRDAVIAKDAEVIEAQAAQIVALKVEVVQLTTSRDDWKAACDLRDKQAAAQAAATQAWKEAVTASRWQGRIEGFALGTILGLAGGHR